MSDLARELCEKMLADARRLDAVIDEERHHVAEFGLWFDEDQSMKLLALLALARGYLERRVGEQEGKQ